MEEKHAFSIGVNVFLLKDDDERSAKNVEFHIDLRRWASAVLYAVYKGCKRTVLVFPWYEKYFSNTQ